MTAYNTPLDADLNPTTGSGSTLVDYGTGFNGISNVFTDKLNTATTNLNTALAQADFTNPGTLLKIQQSMATYQVGLGVIASMVKSFEDTLKGITQKM